MCVLFILILQGIQYLESFDNDNTTIKEAVYMNKKMIQKYVLKK